MLTELSIRPPVRVTEVLPMEVVSISAALDESDTLATSEETTARKRRRKKLVN